MKDGFISVGAASVEIRVADVSFNEKMSLKQIQQAAEEGIQVLVFPELSLTGITCGDLFYSELLPRKAMDSLIRLKEATAELDILFMIGLPVWIEDQLYSCAAIVSGGKIHGIIPQSGNGKNASIKRAFSSWNRENTVIRIDGEEIPVGSNLLFQCEQLSNLRIGVEIGSEMWMPEPPAVRLSQLGATLIATLGADAELVGLSDRKENLFLAQSRTLICGRAVAEPGYGESTTDVTYSGRHLISEYGKTLAVGAPYSEELISSEMDFNAIALERRKTAYPASQKERTVICFPLKKRMVPLTRTISPFPFIPEEEEKRDQRCEEILNIQAQGLRRRMEHTGASSAIIGVSGGLDSTLAMLVADRALKLLGRPSEDLLAVTMPCFGTTSRTRTNAEILAEELGASFKEIDISKSVRSHFEDIDQSEQDHSVTFENAQARERTQVLMDIANQNGGLVVGTGDLSELALGWATYNGDHMSMYGVNGGIPKTLIRVVVQYAAKSTDNPQLRTVLEDILNTPVSPELLPAVDGAIQQKTEEIVGPYELHDFYLYYMVRMGFEPSKILRLAETAFQGQYSRTVLVHWLKTFLRRFISQQYKRSCLPDGPAVGSISLSPRGSWIMPSDAGSALWTQEAEHFN